MGGMMPKMINEPSYIAQTGEPEHIAAPKIWRDKHLAEARERGCTFFRFSVWPPERPITILLLEGWKGQPRDQGEPRFFIRPEWGEANG
jgi:hypothetical protein